MKHIMMGCVGLGLVLMAGLVMAEKPETQNLSRAVLKIESLSCGGCFSTINAGLSKLEGFSGMGTNLFRKLVAVDFAAPLTADKISQTLSEVGYPGNLEAVDAISEKESFVYLESKRTGFSSRGGSCCSGGRSPEKNDTNQASPGLITPSGSSCCTLPSISQPEESL